MLIPLALPPGLHTNDTSFSAEGRWAEGNNVRFVDGRPVCIQGWTGIDTAADGTLIVSIGLWRSSAGQQVIYGTRSNGLYKGGPGAVVEISGTAPAANVGHWSIDSFGSILLFTPHATGTPANEGLYEWSGAGSAVAVATAPETITSMLVTPERQVMALGCNEEVSSAFNGKCIRWSDIEDYSAWSTSSSNNAGEHVLESTTDIVRGLLIGSHIAVWTRTGLHIGQFVGDPGQTFRFDRVDEGCGLASFHGVCVLNGFAYWISREFCIFRWAPGTLPEVIACPILDEIRENCTVTNWQANTFIYPIPSKNEIWFHYKDERDPGASFPSRYFAYSLAESSRAQKPVWFKGIMSRSAAVNPQHLDASIMGAYEASTYITANGLEILAQGVGNTADGSAMDWHIQSTDFYLNESQTRMMIRGVIPDFEDQVGDVTMTLYIRDRPQSAAVTKGPFSLTASTTKKDFRASGKIASVKFSGGDATGSYVRLGKQLFDAVPMGER